MHAHRPYSFLSLIILATMLLMLAFPVPVRADGGAPVPTNAPAGGGAGGSTTPSTTPVSGDSGLVLVSVKPVANGAAHSSSSNQPELSANNVAAAVTALANTDTVVTDVNGNPVMLASQQAANALSTGDPIGCPPGVKPVSWGGTGVGCTSSYSSIQSAINDAAVTSGWTIYIDSGTYQENVQVTKSVTLQGASQGSTIIYPGVSNPDIACAGSCPANNATDTIIWVQADNVTISDLTVNGDNPFLTSGVAVGGADIDAHNGIMSDGSGLTVTNVTVKNVYERGIQSRKDNATYQITNNTVSNVQGDYYSIGIFAYNGSGTIANNNVFDAGDAISANWSHGTQFLNNTVSNSGSGIHTDNAGEFGSTDTIAGNTISNGTAGAYGVWAFAPFGTVNIDNNTITNVDVGLAAVAQNSSSGVVNFNGNTVKNSGSFGAYVTTYEFGWGFTNVDATFNNNIFSGGSSGLYFESTTGQTLTVTGSNNSIANLTGPGAATAEGKPGYYGSYSTDGTYTIDLRNNWWGCSTGPGTSGCTTVEGSILYDPWLTINPFGSAASSAGGHTALVQPGVSPVIPVTGGEPVVIPCVGPSVILQVGEVQVTFTGLCGYSVVMDALSKDSLPGPLEQGNNFSAGLSLDLLKDGNAVNTLPAGAGIQVSYPQPAATASILAWNGSSWVEKSSTTMDARVIVNLDMPVSTVLVTH